MDCAARSRAARLDRASSRAGAHAEGLQVLVHLAHRLDPRAEDEDSRGLAQELPFCAPSLELSRQPLDVQADRVVARIREGQAERKAALQAQADALQAALSLIHI